MHQWILLLTQADDDRPAIIDRDFVIHNVRQMLLLQHIFSYNGLPGE